MFEDVKNCGAGKFISNGEWIHPNRIIDSNEIIFVTKGEVYINENARPGANVILYEAPKVQQVPVYPEPWRR